MLDLKKDLFARLVISAHKNKSLNKPFRVIHADKWDNSSSIKIEKESNLDETVVDVPKSSTIFTSLKSKSVEKIDETVEKIIADPVLLEIKAELEFAEALLQKIKSIDKHNSKIPVIEQTVSRLKLMLDQKMYV